jgi:protease-4
MMKREDLIRIAILVTGLVVFVFVSVYALTAIFSRQSHPAMALSRNKIAVIEIEGIIFDSSRVLESLKRFMEDRNVKGIILRIDSPGGAVAPSQEIYSEVWKIHQEGKKKIVASFGNVAASGAYYVASATDKIISNAGTITGSIGVIMEMSNIQGLLEKIGVESYVVKSGEFKDIGSITRPMSERERMILQNVLDDVYMQFVEDVSKGRGMDLEKVKQIANGSIFSGRQALGLGLVDELGSFQKAVDVIKEMAGIEGEPSLIYEKPEKTDWFNYLPKGILRGLFHNKLDLAHSGAFFLMP